MGQLVHRFAVGDEVRVFARGADDDALPEITVRLLENKGGKRVALGIEAPETLRIDFHPLNGVKPALS